MGTGRTTWIDPSLADADDLAPRCTSPKTFAALAAHARMDATDHELIKVAPNPQRDRLLTDYRCHFRDQFIHDVDYNLQDLWRWAERLDSSQPLDRDTIARDVFGRLNRLRRTLFEVDAWASTRDEMEYEGAAEQFYYNALALGDHLLRREQTTRSRHGELRRPLLRRSLQATINEVERGIPGMFCMRPFRALLPALVYYSLRTAVPWPAFRFVNFLDKMRGIVARGTLGSLNNAGRDVVEERGGREFFGDPYFFDRTRGQTRHNIILAFSHRHPTLDLPVLGQTLGGIEYGIWVNARYFPKSSVRNPNIVVVVPGGKKPLGAALVRSADIAQHRRLPVVIAVDGIPPNLLYGQQTRVKRGIRLMTDFIKAQSAGTGRRTYVVPVSLDDTVSFIRGLDSRIRVTVHRPIDARDIAPAPTRPDRRQVNWGDPLLNHLECLFLAHSGQIRHGWRPPCVAETVRRIEGQLQASTTWIARLRRQFHASMFDLSRNA